MGAAKVSRSVSFFFFPFSLHYSFFLTLILIVLLPYSVPQISQLFALVVLYSDDYLFVCEEREAADKMAEQRQDAAARFMKITAKLPQELQMVICNLTFGRNKSFVLTKESEPAFKEMIKLVHT